MAEAVGFSSRSGFSRQLSSCAVSHSGGFRNNSPRASDAGAWVAGLPRFPLILTKSSTGGYAELTVTLSNPLAKSRIFAGITPEIRGLREGLLVV
jgi:hypothetical protein